MDRKHLFWWPVDEEYYGLRFTIARSPGYAREEYFHERRREGDRGGVGVL